MAKKVAAQAAENKVTSLPVKKKADQLPVTITDAAKFFSQHEAAGFENLTARDLLIPRIAILQKLSPQLSKSKSEFIKGAAEGDICNVATQELYEPPLHFLAVAYKKQYLEWAPRNTNKGLVMIHDDGAILEKTTQDDKRRNVLPNGNYIADTAQFFGLNLLAGNQRCFIAMAGTQLKKARRWLMLATGEKLKREDGTEYTAPIYYRTYMLNVQEESNAEGEWMGWAPVRDKAIIELPNWQKLAKEAQDFRNSIVRGELQGDVSSMAKTQEDEDEEATL